MYSGLRHACLRLQVRFEQVGLFECHPALDEPEAQPSAAFVYNGCFHVLPPNGKKEGRPYVPLPDKTNIAYSSETAFSAQSSMAADSSCAARASLISCAEARISAAFS